MAVGFEGEKYECLSCTGSIGEPSEVKGWKCKSCGQLLRILAEYPEDVRRVLERVRASELCKYDLVVLDGSSLEESNEVLAVEEMDGMYRIALKGFGVLKKIKASKEFNRVIGAW